MTLAVIVNDTEPFGVDWVISRDVSIKPSLGLVAHTIDHNVDGASEYLLQGLMAASAIPRFALSLE